MSGLIETANKLRAMIDAMTNQNAAPVPPLWLHQREALERAGSKFALFFDPGCGKTRTVIELYKRSLKESRSQRYAPGRVLDRGKVLVLAPLNVCRNWPKELGQFLGLPHRIWLVAGQSKAKKIEALQAFRDTPVHCHHIMICNLESLRTKDYRELLQQCGASFMIVDESHNFRSPTSLQTKGLLDVTRALRPNYLYLLTGTPAPQGEIDLWSTFYLLGRTSDPFFVWRKKYFDDKNERRRGTANYWPDYTIRPASRKLFQQILAECSQTARKDEVLDLPELLRTTVYAELSPEQKRHYETMLEFLFAIDEDGHELNAANVLVRTMRLQQILAGFLGNVPMKENPRLGALDAALEMVGEKEQFVIWTIFSATYKQLGEYLDNAGISFGLLTGEQSAEERAETIDRFQAGELRALIAHPKAGGVGVNLTAASYSIHYTRSFSLVDDLQAEARNYRGGSERHKRITRIDIVASETIDEEIAEALQQKKSVQDFILGLKRAYGK